MTPPAGTAGLARRHFRAASHERVAHTPMLAPGLAALASELEAHAAELAREGVWNVLQWVPRISEELSWSMLGRAGVGAYSTVGDLTGRQLGALIDALREGARRRGA